MRPGTVRDGTDLLFKSALNVVVIRRSLLSVRPEIKRSCSRDQVGCDKPQLVVITPTRGGEEGEETTQ